MSPRPGRDVHEPVLSEPGFRLLDTAGYAAPGEPGNAGKPPRMDWVALADMCIDERYQRPLSRIGRANIEKIAREFCWGAFTPVIVAPRSRPRPYAVIDGQHRCIAALLAGYARVPCMIIAAGLAEQARLFLAVNTNVTRVHSHALFHTTAEALDGPERAARTLAAACGVTIARYPIPLAQMKPGWTMAHGEIMRAMRTIGPERTADGLTAIVHGVCPEAASPGNAGLLNIAMLRGIFAAIAARPQVSGPQLIACFQSFDLSRVNATAAAFPGITGKAQQVAASIGRRIDAWLGQQPVAQGPAAAPPPGPAIVKSRHGVSLPMLKSLQGGDG